MSCLRLRFLLMLMRPASAMLGQGVSEKGSSVTQSEGPPLMSAWGGEPHAAGQLLRAMQLSPVICLGLHTKASISV